MNIRTLVMLILGITLILIPVACAGGGSDTEDKKPALQQEAESSVKSSAATAPTAPPAALTPQEGSVQQEQPGKQEWVTLTDLDRIFSISVPTHWETTIDLEKLAVEHQSLFEQGVMVLFFGIDTQTGSNVTVMADMQALVTEEPQPIDRGGYMELQVQDLEQLPNVGEITKKDVTIDGINGTQLRYTMSGEVHQIANILLGNEPRMACGSMGILVNATTPWAGKYEIGESALAVVEQIVDSFRVLPTAAITDTCDDRKALSMLEVVGATEEGMVEVDGLRLVEWELSSHEYALVTIEGVLENTTDDLKELVYVTFDLYDKEGFSLGQAEAFTERLHAGKKWRFEAIGATEAELGEIELYDLGTY